MKFKFLNMDNESGFILIEKELKRLKITAQVKEDSIELKGENVEQARIYLQTLFNSNIVELDDNQKSANTIIERLKSLGLKMAVAESCSGGLLSHAFTSISGASAVFMGGVVCYSEEVKRELLKVNATTLKVFGVYSEECVKEMLLGVFLNFKADLALAISGVAGPNGGSKANPVGTIYIGAQKLGSQAFIDRCFFEGDRENIQNKSVEHALNMLAKML
ncbi:nicotinamide-nucleotide amidohydrolase family protein [Helicobacter pylori]|uniref:nicotinamide-nucleotide amidohydrolase family protein n=1 Tax=Helicobacter pylori TaxID=210 RepID=UPI00026B29CC|nr:nicotinamide-nucleotide amidohydrolase family protein [Helicobacter pylori]EJC14775.1 competence/damage-inducible CinA C-terminal domain protein [Helicobacter pylori Hp P-25]EJC34637.1 competence/damage-inducible CinA C-terminal domain protein [Helicobacter pylori Hp P-25c]EJC36915.1 competence/damage-inducible CinA C-terminal domain protein [Helicobacter pylori Hp P-25d]